MPSEQRRVGFISWNSYGNRPFRSVIILRKLDDKCAYPVKQAEGLPLMGTMGMIQRGYGLQECSRPETQAILERRCGAWFTSVPICVARLLQRCRKALASFSGNNGPFTYQIQKSIGTAWSDAGARKVSRIPD